jgi:hypothetical protein
MTRASTMVRRRLRETKVASVPRVRARIPDSSRGKVFIPVKARWELPTGVGVTWLVVAGLGLDDPGDEEPGLEDGALEPPVP